MAAVIKTESTFFKTSELKIELGWPELFQATIIIAFAETNQYNVSIIDFRKNKGDSFNCLEAQYMQAYTCFTINKNTLPASIIQKNSTFYQNF